MIQKINDLPNSVDGFDAIGTVTRDDYENTLVPLMKNAHKEGRRIRLLYRLGNQFEKFTAGAAWDDFRIGIQYLRLFERCAVVTDSEWLRKGTLFGSTISPCPIKLFRTNEMKSAVEWLTSSANYRNLSIEPRALQKVVLVEIKGPLTREDFESLGGTVDSWIESHQEMNGIVIHTKKFPGWENFGTLIRHFQFVREHHRKIKHVAIVVDGMMAELAPKLASHFVQAQIRHFNYHELEKAIEWAAGNSQVR